MGVMKLFSSDSRDCGCNQPRIVEVEKVVRVNSTPDPTNFRIMKRMIINGYPIFKVKYPGVKNYEGEKILMYPKDFDLSKIDSRMDPHFFTEGDSPIARFEPTKRGWNLAATLAITL